MRWVVAKLVWKKLVSDQSSAFERDVPGMHMMDEVWDEVGFKQKFRFSCAPGHFPATTARVSQPRRSGIFLKTEHE